MRVAGYARVSTDIQRERETINTQTEMIREYCKTQGHTLTEIYCDDGVSGTIDLSLRPGASRMLAAAQVGLFEGLVVYKADRIGRDVLVNEMAARTLYDGLGIQFLGITEHIDLATPTGRAMFTFQSVIGRLERENTLQRSWDALVRLAREGVWLGGIVPYGYRLVGKDRDARLRISDEKIPGFDFSEADVIRLIYHFAGDLGLSSMTIADHLNALGVPTAYERDEREVTRNKRKQRTCGVWRAGRVRNMLVETTYKGTHKWGKRGKLKKPQRANAQIIERPVPAIVEEDLWERAQLTLYKNRIVPPNTKTRKYLLRGLMKCTNCGLTYVGATHKGAKAALMSPEELEGKEIRDGRVVRAYYLCNGSNLSHAIYGRTGCRCNSVSVRAQELEELVWTDIEAFLREPGEVLAHLQDKLQQHTDDTQTLRQRLQFLQNGLDAKEGERTALYRLFRRGGISEADLERQLQEVLTEEKVLQEEAERLQQEMGGAQNPGAMLSSVEELLMRLREKLDAGVSWETKRQIVEMLVDSMEVSWRQEGKHRVAVIAVRYAFDEPTFVVGRRAQARYCAGVRAGFTVIRGVNAPVRVLKSDAI